MMAAALHDGTYIRVTVKGSGPAVLISVGMTPATGVSAKALSAEGLDTRPGQTLVTALSRHFTVVAFDYEAHRLEHPAPRTLSPSNLASDLLAIADAADVGPFAYYGYSWLGVAGLALAGTSERLTALAVGGFPPAGAPFEALWQLAVQAQRAAVGRSQTTNPSTSASFLYPGEMVQQLGEEERALMPLRAAQARQFVTLFRHLKDNDDGGVPQVGCPALCFAGSEDIVAGTHGPISMAAPLVERRQDLEAADWTVRVLDGMDQVEAMQPQTVSAVVVQWLRDHLGVTLDRRPVGKVCGSASEPRVDGR